jgi:hypothetical protein
VTSTQISAWLALFFGGLWAGGILIFAVERTNLWQRMPIDQYAVDFRRSLLRADPMMPIFAVLTGIASTVFAILLDGGAERALAWSGMGLVVLGHHRIGRSRRADQLGVKVGERDDEVWVLAVTGR